MMDLPKVAVSITRKNKPSGGHHVACVDGKPDAEMTFPKAGGQILIIDHTGRP